MLWVPLSATETHFVRPHVVKGDNFNPSGLCPEHKKTSCKVRGMASCRVSSSSRWLVMSGMALVSSAALGLTSFAGLTTKLAVKPGQKPGEVVVSAQLTNTQGTPLRLFWSRDPQQDCTPSLRVRVLKAGSRDVVYPNATEQQSFCTADVREQVIAPGKVHQEARTLVLAPGRYAIEVRIPGVGSAMNAVRAGYVMVTVR